MKNSSKIFQTSLDIGNRKYIAWLGHNDKNEMNEIKIKDSKIIDFYYKINLLIFTPLNYWN